MVIVQEIQHQFNNIEELIAWCEQEELVSEEALNTLDIIVEKELGAAFMQHLFEIGSTFVSQVDDNFVSGVYKSVLNAELTEDTEHLFNELESIKQANNT